MKGLLVISNKSRISPGKRRHTEWYSLFVIDYLQYLFKKDDVALFRVNEAMLLFLCLIYAFVTLQGQWLLWTSKKLWLFARFTMPLKLTKSAKQVHVSG